jgi:hypothetical protein
LSFQNNVLANSEESYTNVTLSTKVSSIVSNEKDDDKIMASTNESFMNTHEGNHNIIDIDDNLSSLSTLTDQSMFPSLISSQSDNLKYQLIVSILQIHQAPGKTTLNQEIARFKFSSKRSYQELPTFSAKESTLISNIPRNGTIRL